MAKISPVKISGNELKVTVTGFNKLFTRFALPVLNCVRVKRSKDGWVSLTLTDLTSWATRWLQRPQTQSVAELEFLVPFQKLKDMLKEHGSDVEYALQPGRIDCGKQCCEFDQISVDDFPVTPVTAGTHVSLTPEMKRAFIEATAFCSDMLNQPPILGVHFDVTRSAVAATNRHVLYFQKFEAMPLQKSFTFPNGKFLTWKGFADDGNWHMIGGLDGTEPAVMVCSNYWRLTSKTIPLAFPSWMQVVPCNFHSTVDFSVTHTKQNIEAVKACPTWQVGTDPVGVRHQSGVVKFFGFKNCGEKNQKEIRTTAATNAVQGRDFMVVFKRRYVLQALSLGLHRMRWADQEGQPVSFTDGYRTLLVMPFMTKEAAEDARHEAAKAAK